MLGEIITEMFGEGIGHGILTLILNFFRLIGAITMSAFTLFQKSVPHFYKKGEDSSILYLIGFFLSLAIGYSI